MNEIQFGFSLVGTTGNMRAVGMTRAFARRGVPLDTRRMFHPPRNRQQSHVSTFHSPDVTRIKVTAILPPPPELLFLCPHESHVRLVPTPVAPQKRHSARFVRCSWHHHHPHPHPPLHPTLPSKTLPTIRPRPPLPLPRAPSWITWT